MSQRQLAQQSGVDHSTISRLIRGDRMPSLGTATKLARGLRELRDDADATQYLGVVASGTQNPTARVEYALRADELLNEAQVRQIMEYYLAVRMRRFGRAFQPSENSGSRTEGSGGGNGHPPGHAPAGAAGPAPTDIRRAAANPPSAIAVGTVTRVGGSRSGVVRSINSGPRRY